MQREIDRLRERVKDLEDGVNALMEIHQNVKRIVRLHVTPEKWREIEADLRRAGAEIVDTTPRADEPAA